MTTSGSISFDDAADFYDRTRGLSPDVETRVTDLLVTELHDRTSVLEVGVGTGRIARPLARRGVSLVGLDLAQNMLSRLVQNAGGSAPFPLIRGDATRLPLRDDSVDAGIVSWVLHLVTGWREILAELVRAIVPGGLLLIDVGGEDDSVLTRLTWKFRDVAGITDWPRGAKSHGEVDDAMTSLGASPRALDPIVENTDMALEDHIRLLEQGIYSVAWSLDESARTAAAGELRRWATHEYGSLTDRTQIRANHVWRAYELKG